jgi:hypothetical protein
MARSPTVPHVPSSSVKVAVPSDVMERVDAVAERAGLTRDDCVELGLRALLDGEESPAAVVWSRYTRGQVQTPADVISALASADVPDSVRGFRLGAPAADRAPVPWPRNGPGADLNADPLQVWPIVRGLWRMRPAGTSVIVAIRLGHVLGVYRVSGWQHEPESGRHYAVGGRAIDPRGRLVDAETGADVGAASAADLAIHNAVSAAPIVLPRGTAQPVVKLSAK